MSPDRPLGIVTAGQVQGRSPHLLREFAQSLGLAADWTAPDRFVTPRSGTRRLHSNLVNSTGCRDGVPQ